MSWWILVGSFTPFVSILEFTPSPPSLSLVSQVEVGSAPSWLTSASSSIDNILNVYATNEQPDAGEVLSLRFNTDTGNLTVTGAVPSGGGAPTHLALLTESDGSSTLGVANYAGSNVGFVRLDEDGSFVGQVSTIAFEGTGPRPNQDRSHPHQIVQWDNEVLVPDLGSDRTWRLSGSGTSRTVAGAIEYAAGSGPRHLAVAQDDARLYTIMENFNSVFYHRLSHDIAEEPEVFGQASTLPLGTGDIAMSAAELAYHPSSETLYASNRGDPSLPGDAITIIKVDGSISIEENVRTGMQQLRGMSLFGEEGEYLIAGGQAGGGIKIYERVGIANLREVVHLESEEIEQPVAFLAIPRQAGTGRVDLPNFTTIPASTPTGSLGINTVTTTAPSTSTPNAAVSIHSITFGSTFSLVFVLFTLYC